MATGHLVTFAELALLGDKHLDDFINTGGKIIALGAFEALNIDDGSLDTVGETEGRIFHVLGLFTENAVEKFKFGGGFGFALRSDLAHQNGPGLYLTTGDHYPFVVEVLKGLFRAVGHVASDAFRPQLRLTDFGGEFLDVDGGEQVFLDHALADQDGVLVVVAVPGNEAQQQVATQGQFAMEGGRAVGQDGTLFDQVANTDNGTMIETSVLVGPSVLH